jgi:hypothetical protein
MADNSGGDRPELADAGRLARKLVGRAVRLARTEDQPLRQVLLDHLGPEAARLPTISGSYPLGARQPAGRGGGVAGGRPGQDA